ncbi:MAG: hypothetical protein M3Q97_08540 [Bacteroidota bacterium]|nr:hypothetical protein [Bacteroidota bacterium]
MTRSEELFHKIAAELPDAKEGKMFGAMCIKAPNGKAAAMYWQDAMVFKLRGDAEREAMSLDSAHLFDPMGGRPMGGWIVVPYAYADRWAGFAASSMGYVKGLR